MVEMMWSVAAIAALACWNTACGSQDRQREERLQAEFTNVTDPNVYNKNVRPFPDQDKPVNVHARMYVYFLGDIDAQSSEFFVQLLVRLRWTDPRLQLNISEECLQGEGWHKNLMWTPTVYFVNQKDSKIIDVSSINVFISICPNGNVYYSFRVQTTLFCGMNLRKFPFDNQTCSVQVESWLYSSDDMIMTWENDAPVSTNVITLAEYQLTGLTEYNSTFSFPEAGPVGKASWRVDKHTLNYSRLVLDFHMLREPGYYLLDYYIPSGFLVIVSWVSFWLSPDAAPARVTLGTSTMLTFITLSNIIKDSLPKVSYTKRVDIWLFLCTTFIFLSLVEFAFVNTIHRRKKNVELKKVTAKHVLKSTIKRSASQVQLGRVGLSSSCSKLDKLGSNHSQIGYGDLLVPCSPKSPERPNVFFIGAQTDDIITSVKELNAKSRTMASKDQLKLSSSMDLGLNSSGSTATSVLASNLALEVQAMVCDGAVESPRRGSVFQRPFVEMTPPQIAKWIDTRSRWLFPICFLATNIVYWISITI